MNSYLTNKPTGPTSAAGERQADGNVSAMGVPPTKAPLQTRAAVPPSANAAGIERAMGTLADKMHPPRRR